MKSNVNQNSVMLSLTQHLQRLPLQLVNSVRGRSRIKYGMTACFKTAYGFTLIELLVVVLIIGILAAVAVPQYQVAVAKSRYIELMTLVHSIKNAQELYYLANGEYATSFDQLDIDIPGGGSAPNENGIVTYPNGTQIKPYHWGRVWACNQDLLCNHYEAALDHSPYPGHDDNGRLCFVRGGDCNQELGHKVCKALGGKALKSSPSTYMLD